MYVLQTIFNDKSKPPNEEQCIGGISLIIWSLILVVSIKYAIFILKADNKGEGLKKKNFVFFQYFVFKVEHLLFVYY